MADWMSNETRLAPLRFSSFVTMSAELSSSENSSDDDEEEEVEENDEDEEEEESLRED